MSLDIDELLKKATELRQEGRLDEAILSARRATSLSPETANAWWQLALAVAQKDSQSAAIEYFKKTVEISEGFAYGWHRLGNAYAELKKTDHAIESWEMACGIDEEDEASRYKLVDVLGSFSA
jgi:tetratricopeptide (TPR) repeat protein